MVKKMLMHIHMTMDFCANSESRMNSSDNSHDELESGETLSVLFRNVITITGVILENLPISLQNPKWMSAWRNYHTFVSAMQKHFPEPHSSYSNHHIKTEGERTNFLFCL